MAVTPITYVVVSYFPLLIGDPGETLDFEDVESFKVLQEVLDRLPDGNAPSCLWALKDGGPMPILVMDGADAIHDHLVAWSEGDPVGWFSLTLLQKDGKYLVGLAPNVKRSIDRFGVARQLRTGFPIPKDAKLNVLFRCLYFVSGCSNTFDLIKDGLPDAMCVGLMDRSLLNVDDPRSMDSDRIRWIGPFSRTSDGRMDEYFGQILDEATEPAERSVIFRKDEPSVP